jgi:hypothetical protein
MQLPPEATLIGRAAPGRALALPHRPTGVGAAGAAGPARAGGAPDAGHVHIQLEGVTFLAAAAARTLIRDTAPYRGGVGPVTQGRRNPRHPLHHSTSVAEGCARTGCNDRRDRPGHRRGRRRRAGQRASDPAEQRRHRRPTCCLSQPRLPAVVFLGRAGTRVAPTAQPGVHRCPAGCSP